MIRISSFNIKGGEKNTRLGDQVNIVVRVWACALTRAPSAEESPAREAHFTESIWSARARGNDDDLKTHLHLDVFVSSLQMAA